MRVEISCTENMALEAKWEQINNQLIQIFPRKMPLIWRWVLKTGEIILIELIVNHLITHCNKATILVYTTPQALK